MIEDSGVASSGTAESFLNAANIPKTRRALQVPICSLNKLLRKAYDSEMLLQDIRIDFDEWCKKKCEKQPTFKYWFMIIRLVMIYLVLILSFREGLFKAYKASLATI